MKKFDAVIVGSGFGGAVTAARLAQAGLDVCILERGRWWGADAQTAAPAGSAGGSSESRVERLKERPERRAFPRGVRQVAGAVRNVRINRGRVHTNRMRDPEGLYELHLHRHLDLLTASGVGGGSLVYTNMQVQPDHDFFDAFPAELRAGELAPYFDRVREMLRPEPVGRRPPKNVVFEDGLRAVGRDRDLEYPDLAVAHGDPDHPTAIVNAAGVSQTSCNWCGNCVLGCMERAKTTLDLTYIPAALAAGAKLRTLAEAEVFAPIDRGGAGRATSPGATGWDVRYHDHETGRRRRVFGDRLILSAGTLGTLRLLLAARDRYRTLGGLSDQLGRHFSGNADQGALLLGTRTEFRSSVGPSVNAFLRHRAPEASSVHRFLAGEFGIPADGLKWPAPLRRSLDSALMLIYMGAGAGHGQVRIEGTELDIDQANSHDGELFAAFDAETESLARTFGAGRVVKRLATGRGHDANFSVHPLGGAAIADDPGRGVCDHAGRVFAAVNLYVADGSLYPTAPGLPPSMTISALAERVAELISRE